MTVILNPQQFYPVARELTQGIRVHRAAANLPQTTQSPLFNITGGRILLVGIIGEVTTVIQTQANGTQLVYNPSGTGADTDLCTDLDITGDAVGTYYSLPAAVGSAMVDGLYTVPWADAHYRILGPGAIELDCAASNTGQVAWTLIYVPFDDGATVAAA